MLITSGIAPPNTILAAFGVPIHERVFIGGEVHVIHLTREGFRTFAHSQFEDYEEVRERILRRYSGSP